MKTKVKVYHVRADGKEMITTGLEDAIKATRYHSRFVGREITLKVYEMSKKLLDQYPDFEGWEK